MTREQQRQAAELRVFYARRLSCPCNICCRLWGTYRVGVSPRVVKDKE